MCAYSKKKKKNVYNGVSNLSETLRYKNVYEVH